MDPLTLAALRKASAALAASTAAGATIAAVDPVAGDDEADGYVVGSVWVNLDPGNEAAFVCSDASEGAAAWAPWPGAAASAPVLSFIIAASDETTALTNTGNPKATFRMPYAFTLTAVRASVTTAPTGSVLTVDINEGGSSILSTKLTIDAGSKTSVGAATPAVISDTSLADNAEITIDIDGVGSTVAGAGLKVTLIGYAT
jgi:hypothetical protein